MAGSGLAYRLPAQIRPTDYHLHLWLDPARSDRYRGRVEIDLEVSEPTREIVLHACDLAVAEAAIERDGSWTPQTLRLRPASETLVVRARGGLAVGKHRLRIRFRGRLRRDLRGLYGVHAEGKRYAFTQLEAADARRFFPCFDEPAFKARFSITVTTAVGHTVISNTPAVTDEPASQGKTRRKRKQGQESKQGEKTVRFAPTPPLSTYLLALAVGELEGSEPVLCGKTPIRIWHLPGNRSMTGFALETASACLSRLEKYFGLPYPYEKLDLVAVPDFEIGAMENAGAVFFRETLLLVDEAKTSLPERKRAAEVICHELAHMWFGNLVTMAWWDDLWLNEAFATWIAFDIVDSWRPAWQMWNDFGHGRDAALDLDGLSNTHAIYTEVRTPDEATENFDLITYEKGAAVVRMLERYLGPKTFRQGVRQYIRAHREGNAVAADLWRELQRAAGEKGIATLVRSWVQQEGFPLVRVDVDRADKPPMLTLTQERFSATGPRKSGPTRQRGQTEKTRWRVPLVLRTVPEPPSEKTSRTRRPRLTRHLLAKRRDTLTATQGAVYYGNADQGGCFRVLHDSQTLQRLSSRLPSLSVPERSGLIADTWALTHAGYADAGDLLSLLLAFADESHPDVLGTVAQSLERLVDGLGAQPARQLELRGQVEAAFLPALERTGLRSRRDDSEQRSLLRAGLYDLLGRVVGTETVQAEATVLCQRYLRNRRAVEPNLAGAVVTVAATAGDGALFQQLLDASLTDGTPQGRRRARMALADFQTPEAIAKLHELCLTDSVPTQDVALVLARQLANPTAREATWAFIKKRWPRLQRRLTPMLVSRLIGALPQLGPDHERDVQAFFRAHPVPTGQRTLRQARERFRLERAFRRRLAKELAPAT